MSLLDFFGRLGFCCWALVLLGPATCRAAQQPGSSTPYNRPDVSRVVQNQFINDYLGIQFSIPSGWVTTDVGDGQAEPVLVDGRKVFLLLRIAPSKSPAEENQVVLRTVDVLHKDIDSSDLSLADESLEDFRPVSHPGIYETMHVENPMFFCGHYEPRISSGPQVNRTKCVIPGGRRFLTVLTIDSAETIPKKMLEELAGSWKFDPSSSSKEEEEVHDWVQLNFASVLEDYLPLRVEWDGIAYRSNQDLHTSVLEYSFVLRRDSSSATFAVVRMPDSRSIYDQMFLQRMENPSVSIEQVKALIKVKEWTIRDTDCPAVGTAMQDFWKSRLNRGRTDVIILHPLIYEFHVQSNTMRAKVTITDVEHPWARWATRTRTKLQACATKIPLSPRLLPGPPPKP